MQKIHHIKKTVSDLRKIDWLHDRFQIECDAFPICTFLDPLEIKAGIATWLISQGKPVALPASTKHHDAHLLFNELVAAWVGASFCHQKKGFKANRSFILKIAQSLHIHTHTPASCALVFATQSL
ncbi:hypothetical protein V8J88_03540 [Massilia sp. W12]|uniref:hypothetical protein n=1 Tax=Massilia sp. W12 TaxID=3126507 RepID=UPI0030CB2643